MSTQPLNPISFRLPTFDLSTDEGRQDAHRYLASGMVDVNQAIASLKQQVDANHATAMAAVASVGQSSTTVISSNPFPYLGTVNDQRGNVSYLTEVTDNGAKIVLGDSSPITVTLNAAVTPPWFCIIDNDSTSMVTLTPSGGSIVGPNIITDSGFGIVFYNGANFFCGTT